MNVDEFWRLVEILGPAGAAGRVDDLDAALVAGGQSCIEEFDEQLWAAVRQLRTSEHQNRTVFDVGDPSDASPIPQSDDVAEDTAFAVVSMGRDVFDRVRTDPSHLDAGPWLMRTGCASRPPGRTSGSPAIRGSRWPATILTGRGPNAPRDCPGCSCLSTSSG